MAELTATSQLILALDARADALRARSIADACSGAFWLERFGERGTRRIEEDAQHHISQLKTALQFGDPSILAQYAIWLQQVLTHRGMCSQHLAEHFDALAQAIRDEALSHARIAEEYLQVAVDALSYRSEPARTVEDAAEVLADSMLEALGREEREATRGDRVARDIAYLLSYLTDAIKLGRPDVFSQYVVWIGGYFTRRGRPEGYLSSILRALDVTLVGIGGDVRDASGHMVIEARALLAGHSRSS